MGIYNSTPHSLGKHLSEGRLPHLGFRMRNMLLVVISLVCLHLVQGASWWRPCNIQSNHDDFEKQYPSVISSVDVRIKQQSSSSPNVGCSTGNRGCKIPARSTLEITLQLKSNKSVKKVKATLQGHLKYLGWISAVNINKLNLKRIKKNKDHEVKFDYTLPFTGFSGMKMPTAIRLTGKSRGKEIVIGCVLFPMNIV